MYQISSRLGCLIADWQKKGRCWLVVMIAMLGLVMFLECKVVGSNSLTNIVLFHFLFCVEFMLSRYMTHSFLLGL